MVIECKREKDINRSVNTNIKHKKSIKMLRSIKYI